MVLAVDKMRMDIVVHHFNFLVVKQHMNVEHLLILIVNLEQVQKEFGVQHCLNVLQFVEMVTHVLPVQLLLIAVFMILFIVIQMVMELMIKCVIYNQENFVIHH